MSSWGQVYKETIETLEGAGFSEARAEAGVLLAHVYGGDFSQLCLRFFDECPKSGEIQKLLAQRLSGKPLAYVLREKYFYGRPFTVDGRVLIPRYDTEPVVEKALMLAQENGYTSALDLCCGSGIIGITLAAEGTFETVCFSDLSADALQVAQKNADTLIAAQKRTFFQGDFLEPVAGTFDLVVCNPPYISPADYAGLEAQVREFEPQAALVAKSGGYAFYERAAREVPAVLKSGGALVLEIGDTQAQRVCALLKEGGFDKIEYGFDLSGRPRWVAGTVK